MNNLFTVQNAAQPAFIPPKVGRVIEPITPTPTPESVDVALTNVMATMSEKDVLYMKEIEEFEKTLASGGNTISEETRQRCEDLILKTDIDINFDTPWRIPCAEFKYGDIEIYNGLNVIAAHLKKGKSQFANILAIQALREGMRVIVADTEQGNGLAGFRKLTIAHSAGYEKEEDWKGKLIIPSTLTPLRTLLGMLKRGDVLIIDGIKDYCDDINNQAKATEIGNLLRDAINTGATIITLIHYNKNNDVLRGALGTELQNRANTVIECSKEENYFCATVEISRFGKDGTKAYWKVACSTKTMKGLDRHDKVSVQRLIEYLPYEPSEEEKKAEAEKKGVINEKDVMQKVWDVLKKTPYAKFQNQFEIIGSRQNSLEAEIYDNLMEAKGARIKYDWIKADSKRRTITVDFGAIKKGLGIETESSTPPFNPPLASGAINLDER